MVNNLLKTSENFSNETSARVKRTIDRLKSDFNYTPGLAKFGYSKIRDPISQKFKLIIITM